MASLLCGVFYGQLGDYDLLKHGHKSCRCIESFANHIFVHDQRTVKEKDVYEVKFGLLILRDSNLPASTST
jgi:hypothetical protein